MIRLDDITLSLGDVSVLDEITLSVDEEEFVALVGPNGAGKTSILRTVNGIFEPDSGAVEIDGQRVTELTAKALARRVATVPQDTHVDFSFTAEQLVEMGRTPYRSRLDWSFQSDPVDAALTRTETTHLRDRPVDELSGGERQRILLARALAQEPRALVLDEPTANLDINHQIQMLQLVRSITTEGRAAIAAIHDLELAARYCDRLLLVEDGAVQVRGPPETVLSHDRLATAFETETAVTTNPVTGTPTVTALGDRPKLDSHVHVAGSGPRATAAIRTLWRTGFEVTAGILPEGDVATMLARRLDVDIVTSHAFEPPSESQREDALALAEGADAVVRTSRDSPPFDDHPTSTPSVHADIGSASVGTTSVDGGQTTAIEDSAELVETVRAYTDNSNRRDRTDESEVGSPTDQK